MAVASNSLALLADAGHMLVDAGALRRALWALHLAARPATRGRGRSGSSGPRSCPPPATGSPCLVVGGGPRLRVGAPPDPPAVRARPGRRDHGPRRGRRSILAAAWGLSRANRSSLNVEGAFQHILYRSLRRSSPPWWPASSSSTTGFDRADPIASLVVVALMLRASWGLLKASMRVLLEAAPEAVDLADVRAHLLEPAHVRDVHDLHVWTVTSDLPAISAHVVVDDSCFLDGHAPQVLDRAAASAWPAISTSSTRPSSSNRPATPTTSPAPTRDGLLVNVNHLITTLRLLGGVQPRGAGEPGYPASRRDQPSSRPASTPAIPTSCRSG